MKALVCKSITFDAAHNLPKHKGACNRLHGHTWRIVLGVYCEVDKVTGMGIDLGDIGEWLKMNVGGLYDHKYLNDLLDNPTAENIAQDILTTAMRYFELPCSVWVYETPTSWVAIQGDPHGQEPYTA